MYMDHQDENDTDKLPAYDEEEIAALANDNKNDTDKEMLDSVLEIKDKKDELKIPHIIDELMAAMERVNKDMIFIKKTLPKIKNSLNHDLRFASKYKKKKKSYKRSTGFAGKARVPKKIIKFLKLTDDTLMPRTDVTRKIYQELRDRKLFYAGNGQVLRADDEVKELFGFDDSINECTNPKDKNGFTFFNFQTHIRRLYIEENIDISPKKAKKNVKKKDPKKKDLKKKKPKKKTGTTIIID